MIWSLKREKWMKGPHLPKKVNFHQGCILAVNRNLAIIYGLSKQKSHSNDKVWSYNFETSDWKEWSNLPLLNGYPIIDKEITCTRLHYKSIKNQ